MQSRSMHALKFNRCPTDQRQLLFRMKSKRRRCSKRMKFIVFAKRFFNSNSLFLPRRISKRKRTERDAHLDLFVSSEMHIGSLQLIRLWRFINDTSTLWLQARCSLLSLVHVERSAMCKSNRLSCDQTRIIVDRFPVSL